MQREHRPYGGLHRTPALKKGSSMLEGNELIKRLTREDGIACGGTELEALQVFAAWLA